MTTMNSVRDALRDERRESDGFAQLSLIAIAALLVTAAVAGMAELHMLPAFSADDFGSLLVNFG